MPTSCSRGLAALIPGARFEVIEGAGHIESHYPQVMRLVGAFLAEGAP